MFSALVGSDLTFVAECSNGLASGNSRAGCLKTY